MKNTQESMEEFIFINGMPSIGKESTFNCCSQLQNQIALLISLPQSISHPFETRAFKQNFWAFNAEAAARQRAGAARPSDRDFGAALARTPAARPCQTSAFYFDFEIFSFFSSSCFSNASVQL